MFKKSYLLVLALSLFLASDAFATHFRFGHTTWKRISDQNGDVTVEFTSVQAWRTSGLDILGFSTLGDGNTFFPTVIDDLLTTTDIAGESYTIRRFVYQHTYTLASIQANGGRFLVTQTSCCRISSLINAGDDSMLIQTLVDLNNGNLGSPVSTIPVIVQLAYGQLNTLQIAAADPDNDPITCRMATSSESLIGSLASFSGESLTTDSSCLLRWDLSSSTVGDVGKKYAAQVILEESNRCVTVPGTAGNVTDCGRVALDFIIEIVEGNPPVCTSNVPVNNTVYAGIPFSATFTATDIDQGDTLTFSAIGAPVTAVFNPASGSSQAAPMVATMSWTPQESDKNSAFAVLATFQDDNGLQGTCSISLFVSPNDPDPQCTEDDIFGTQLSLDGVGFSQLQLLKATVGKFRKAGGSKKQAKTIMAMGKDSYARAWTATWTIPSKQYSCLFNAICVSASNVNELSEYVDAVTELDALIKTAAKQYKKLKKGAKIKPIKKEANKYKNQAAQQLSLVPSESDICPEVPQLN